MPDQQQQQQQQAVLQPQVLQQQEDAALSTQAGADRGELEAATSTAPAAQVEAGEQTGAAGEQSLEGSNPVQQQQQQGQQQQQQQQPQQAAAQQDQDVSSTHLPMQPPTPSGAAAGGSDLAPAATSSSSSTAVDGSSSGSSSGQAPGGSSNSSSTDKGVNAQVLQRYKELLLQTEERCRTAERQASLSGVIFGPPITHPATLHSPFVQPPCCTAHRLVTALAAALVCMRQWLLSRLV